MPSIDLSKQPVKPRVIVVGNEKGGSGKSTTSMHLSTALLRLGLKVATIDLDARQGTLTRYIENRKTYCQSKGVELVIPTHKPIFLSDNKDRNAAEQEDHDNLKAAIEELAETHDMIVVDCPGSDTPLSRFAHTFADILVTPLNESFLDLDVLARVQEDTHEIVRPSHYSELIWEQRKQRALARMKPTLWYVVRNRLSHTQNRNKGEIVTILEKLSKRIGFELVQGFGERVIFKELFLQGLTLLDLKDAGVNIPMTMSVISARQEIRGLIHALGLEQWAKEDLAISSHQQISSEIEDSDDNKDKIAS